MKAGDEVWLRIIVDDVDDGVVDFYHHDHLLSVDEGCVFTDEEVLKELKGEQLPEMEHLADIRNEFSINDWEKIKKNFTPDTPEETFEEHWMSSTSASDLLRGAFTWGLSPEGHIYWLMVNKNLNEKLC